MGSFCFRKFRITGAEHLGGVSASLMQSMSYMTDLGHPG
jgi:hypothetical protein